MTTIYVENGIRNVITTVAIDSCMIVSKQRQINDTVIEDLSVVYDGNEKEYHDNIIKQFKQTNLN